MTEQDTVGPQYTWKVEVKSISEFPPADTEISVELCEDGQCIVVIDLLCCPLPQGSVPTYPNELCINHAVAIVRVDFDLGVFYQELENAPIKPHIIAGLKEMREALYPIPGVTKQYAVEQINKMLGRTDVKSDANFQLYVSQDSSRATAELSAELRSTIEDGVEYHQTTTPLERRVDRMFSWLWEQARKLFKVLGIDPNPEEDNDDK